MFYTVKNEAEAWAKVNQIFPTDYERDEGRSIRAGYPIYTSTAEGCYYDYICELGDRLEVNLSTGETINVWIKSEEHQEQPVVADQPKEPDGYCKIAVKAMKSGEIREFGFEEFIEQIRFFWSSGAECSFEEKLEKMKLRLMEENEHGDAMETVYSGMVIKVIYYRFNGYDRYMNRLDK